LSKESIVAIANQNGSHPRKGENIGWDTAWSSVQARVSANIARQTWCRVLFGVALIVKTEVAWGRMTDGYSKNFKGLRKNWKFVQIDEILSKSDQLYRSARSRSWCHSPKNPAIAARFVGRMIPGSLESRGRWPLQ
jgi:hypothetical protein